MSIRTCRHPVRPCRRHRRSQRTAAIAGPDVSLPFGRRAGEDVLLNSTYLGQGGGSVKCHFDWHQPCVSGPW
eukprot:9982615-Alexandrium_andersonii.AAC.1